MIVLRGMRALRLVPLLLVALGDVAAQTRAIPRFEVEPGWLKVPQGWVLGQVSSSASDTQDHLLGPAPAALGACGSARPGRPLLEFDAGGNYLRGWGGPGDGYDWPESEHGIFLDHQGYVWVGGQGDNDQILKFTKDGKFVLQIGRRGQPKTNRDTQNLSRPSDVFVHPPTNELFVSDGYGNKRIIVFDAATGAYKRMWGAFGNEPLDGPPAAPSAALDPNDRGPQQFSTVHGVKVSKDGRVYVADRGGKRVQAFTTRAAIWRRRGSTAGAWRRARAAGTVRRPRASPSPRTRNSDSSMSPAAARRASGCWIGSHSNCSTRSAARASRPGSSTCCTT